jgi:hypothetical protein
VLRKTIYEKIVVDKSGKQSKEKIREKSSEFLFNTIFFNLIQDAST